MPTDRPLTVGALARQAGVSAQTLRHYDQLGLLEPSATTRAGYRLYSESDRVRLDLIRALRALDFDLETIGKILRGAVTARAVTELHLRTLDLQMKTLTRRRAVLRVLLRNGEKLTFERLQRLQVLASIEDHDRASFVGSALAVRLKGTQNKALGLVITRMAMVDLPESPTDAQVEAWLELAELVSDETFMERHRGARGRRQQKAPDMMALCQPAADAVARGISPGSSRGRAIVITWMDGMLASHRRRARKSTHERARQLRDLLRQNGDPRDRRFWQLLAVLNPQVAQSPITVAWPWLEEGLDALAGTNRP